MSSPFPAATPDPASRFEPFPLNDQQQAYLLGRAGTFDLGDVSTHAYYEYEGELDLDRFTAAWRRVIDRHDMLRAVMLPDTNEQRVLAEVEPFTPEVADLRGLDPGAVTARLGEIRDRLSHQVRPAERWPLFWVVVSLLDGGISRVHVSFDALILDYLSWQLLIRDLTRFHADPDLVVAPLEVTFRDYVLAESALTGTERHRRARRYWCDRVPGLPRAPALPTSSAPAPPRWSSRIARLDAARWGRVRAAAATAGLTPTTLCLAVFADVLTTWSDSAHFAVNVPRMNRFPLHPQVGELLGEFASFSLLEVDNRGAGTTFTERAKRIQRTFWDDLSHQEFSGVRVLRELIRADGGTGAALMPVVLTSTIGFTAGEEPLLGARLPRVFAISQTPQVHLDVQIEETEGELVYNFDAVDGAFPAGLVDALFAAFGAVLHRLADDPGAWSVTDALAPAQRTRGAITGPVTEIPDELVQDGFLRQVRERPDATAVITPTERLTYGGLHERASRVARWLRANGARPGHPVAVLLDRGWQQVVAVYGVLLAGAPYLPLDNAAPRARTAAILAAADVEHVLDDDTLERALAEGGAEPDPADPAGTDPRDIAYVLFTSGSTGTPKGVRIEHRGMVNCLRATVEEFGVTERDVAIAVTAPHHDMSTFDLFGVLGAGGTVVVPTADRDAGQWAGLIAEHGVTLWNSVPAMMAMLVRYTGDAVPPSLRTVFLGGDWIPLPLAATLLPAVELVSVGGPTETTLWNIWHRVVPADLARTSVPYGRPIANTTYHVLDERRADRPDGVAGELCCGGPGVARDYLGDPTRTAESFVEHPVTGQRLFRTGDLGRCLPDGVIEFVGRADTQLKLRGQRIEPGEVEAALIARPGVEDAVVVGVRSADGPGVRALAAYVTGTASGDEVRAGVRAVLPEHMVPATVTVLPAFPLTSNGKVDRAALARRPIGPAAGHTAPRTPLELIVAQVWAAALEVERVGVADDFFALGGDSVVATTILSRLRDALDTPDLPLLALLRTGTVAGMCAALTDQETTPGRLATVAELYQRIAQLSDEEIDAELSRR